jgi:hypothetical protein
MKKTRAMLSFVYARNSVEKAMPLSAAYAQKVTCAAVALIL